MRIDFHSHFIPRTVVEAADTGADWHGVRMSRTETGELVGHFDGRPFDLPGWTAVRESVAQRLAQMDAMRLDKQVLSIAPRLQRYYAEPRSSIACARSMNDDLVETIAAAPDRLLGLVHLPLQDVAAAAAEVERSAGRPGIVGFGVGSNVNGAPWDSPALFPVLRAVADSGLVMFVHPADRPKDPRMGRFHLNNLVGNPLETTLAIAAFIFGGVLDRLPSIKLCFAHAGGYAVLGSGRFDAGYEARADVRSGSAQLPSDYLGKLYYDSITFSDIALKHLVDVVGASQVLLGSDYPADMGTLDPVGFVEQSRLLGDADKRKILGENAQQLVGTPIAAAASDAA